MQSLLISKFKEQSGNVPETTIKYFEGSMRMFDEYDDKIVRNHFRMSLVPMLNKQKKVVFNILNQMRPEDTDEWFLTEFQMKTEEEAILWIEGNLDLMNFCNEKNVIWTERYLWKELSDGKFEKFISDK